MCVSMTFVKFQKIGVFVAALFMIATLYKTKLNVHRQTDEYRKYV